VVDAQLASLNEISKAQLNAGSNIHLTPAIVLTSPDLNHPNFLTFDKGGNAIPYHMEDSAIRLEFEQTVAREGAKSRMNPVFYERPPAAGEEVPADM